MTLAAREDEISIAALLNISSENGLHILLRIIAYLLELINGNDTFFIGLLRTGKYLILCIERIRNITQRKIKRWGIGNRIVTEAAIDRLQGVNHHSHHLGSTMSCQIKYSLSQLEGKFMDAGSSEDIDGNADKMVCDSRRVHAKVYQYLSSG